MNKNTERPAKTVCLTTEGRKFVSQTLSDLRIMNRLTVLGEETLSANIVRAILRDVKGEFPDDGLGYYSETSLLRLWNVVQAYAQSKESSEVPHIEEEKHYKKVPSAGKKTSEAGSQSSDRSQPIAADTEASPPDKARALSRADIESQPLTPYVIGRDADLHWLRDTFFPSDKFAEGAHVGLTGFGGMGKTTLALEYARQMSDRYKHVFFCLSDTHTNLSNSFMAIAEVLMSESDEIARLVNASRSTPEDIKNITSAVHNWLIRSTDYLLIFDNADLMPADVARQLSQTQTGEMITEEIIAEFLPNPTYLRGHLLITSRNDAISEIFGAVRHRRLDQLEDDEARHFLLLRTDRSDALLPHSESVGLSDLIGRLHGIPLALEQAGAYIREKHQAFSTYFDMFTAMPEGDWTDPAELSLRLEEAGISVLEYASPKFGKYRSSIAKTWLISFDAILIESPAAAEVFNLSAFLDPDAAPYELIEIASQVSFSDDGEPALPALHTFYTQPMRDLDDRVLEPLCRYSLVKKNLGNQTYQIHRMVQTVRRTTLSEEKWNHYFDVNVMVLSSIFN